MKKKLIQQDLLTEFVPPDICPVITWAWIISTSAANRAYYDAKFEAEKRKILEEVQPKSFIELMRQGMKECFGIDMEEIQAGAAKSKSKTPKCKACKCYLGNSNCSTSGRLGDAERGSCHCDRCLEKLEVPK